MESNQPAGLQSRSQHQERLPEAPQRHLPWLSLTLATLTFLLTSLIGFLIYQNQLLQKQIKDLAQQQQEKGQTNHQSQISLTPSPTIQSQSSPTTSLSSTHYYLELTQKNSNTDEIKTQYQFLNQAIQSILELTQSQIDKLVFVVDEISPYSPGSSIYNTNYYLVLKNGNIDTSKIFQDENIKIKVTPVDTQLEAYINDPDYCEIDSDCQIRTNFCTYGSFNKYHKFVDVWGCGAPRDESGYTFQIHDENLGCVTEVTYQGSKCINNKCEAQGRQVSCN